METIILTPVNGRKSFGGKAVLLIENNLIQLKSYDIIVAYHDKETNVTLIRDYYSATTLTHINSFLHYLGMPTVNKYQLESVYLSQFTKKIKRVDVQNVADNIEMKISEEDIDYVMFKYDLYSGRNVWNIVVGDLLYQRKNHKN